MKNGHDIQRISVGSRIAEQEIEGLKSYFIKTPLWEDILDNEVDIIFGCKGSGKSAIYGYLSTLEYDLMSDNVLLTLAENPRGTIAFKDLAVTPPVNEFEFKCIWKLYFVILIYQKLFDFNYSDLSFKEVTEKLQDSDLIPRSTSFTSIIKLVRGYIKRVNPIIEPNVSLNEYSGAVEKIGLKVSMLEPCTKMADKGIVSVDYLLSLLNSSLLNKKEFLWITIDRLDAIFQEDFELEATALRTLFQVYIDLQVFTNIRLIIFLRDDIWNRIIEHGFRETSHITKTDTITWNQQTLFTLIMSRFEQNEGLIHSLKLEKLDNILERREELFRRIFPINKAENSGSTFDWLIAKIKDGNNVATPRELIQLITTAIKFETKELQSGKINSESLLSFDSLIEGLKDASKTKLETLIAEYPGLKHFVYLLKKRKVHFEIDELKQIWNIGRKEAIIISDNLMKVGFFNKIEEESIAHFYIPIIFRPALGIQII
ncbi:MAG: hypothetical protein Q8S54_10445 [Bacteroidota bacterium]|nr:hypothetical protein [Odoribacter sp.]MDP3643594.1 hypothetical protein [Bacteroidota bacterium]